MVLKAVGCDSGRNISSCVLRQYCRYQLDTGLGFFKTVIFPSEISWITVHCCYPNYLNITRKYSVWPTCTYVRTYQTVKFEAYFVPTKVIMITIMSFYGNERLKHVPKTKAIYWDAKQLLTKGKSWDVFGAARKIVDISASCKIPAQTIKITGFNN